MELNQLVTQWKAASDENEGDVNNTDEWKYDRDLILGFISASPAPRHALTLFHMD